MGLDRRSDRFLDIETALTWAYQDELPKRHTGGKLGHAMTLVRAVAPQVSPMFRGAVPDGGDRDGEWRAPGFPAALGEPDAGALAIEAAVGGLLRFAGQVFAGEPAHPDPAGLGIGLEWLCALARDGDGGGPPAAIDVTAAGAEAIANMAAIVACHARAATRPPLATPRPAPHAVTGANGKPAVVIDQVIVEIRDGDGATRHVLQGGDDDPGDGIVAYRTAVASPAMRAGLYAPGAYCPLAYRPAPARVVAERAEWAAWRMGLGILRQELAGRLAGIVLLGPSAPWRPWAWDGGAESAPLLRAPDRPVVTREAAAAPRRALVRRARAAAE